MPLTTYRCDRFELRHMLADLRFDPVSPRPGDRLPDLHLDIVDGSQVHVSDLDRPHLFVFGSNTCPITASAAEPLRRLHDRFGDAIGFVLVQVREAHPGEDMPQPASEEAKVAHARTLRDAP